MKRKLTSQILYFLSAASAAVTVFVFISIVAHILAKGLPNIRLSSFDFKYTAENLSMLPACINTLVTVAAVVAFSLPLSVMAAVYLTEYSNDNIAAKLINAAIDTLAAIPSIIYGLFGYLCFSVRMNFGFSFISGVATLSLMVLPIIVNSTQAAINSVSNAVRDGGVALGAGRAKTSLRLILPAAKQGIISGVILSVGKITGETAALIYTMGSSPETISGLFSSGRTLAVHIYALCCEGLYIGQAYAASAMLVFITAFINVAANLISAKACGGKANEK